MKPLVKWPGGKSRELLNIKPQIPPGFERFIEPFLGGGAVYFSLNHDLNIVNDVNADLIKLYSMIKEGDSSLFNAMEQIATDWDNMSRIVEFVLPDFQSIKETLNQEVDLKSVKLKYLRKSYSDVLDKYSSYNFGLRTVHTTIFAKFLFRSLISKVTRIAKLERSHNKELTDQWSYHDHLENAIRSAYYTILRDTEASSEAERIARFFFIREFCYGSMFRYNKLGKFNIPYGGVGYNKKSFMKKYEYARSAPIRKLFSNTEFHNQSFDTFLETVKPTEKDFVFFDPPYDSDFKDYGMNPFTKDHQQRLAEIFRDLPSKNLMIIGKTPYIYGLYQRMKEENPSIEITDYEKTYSYNVRGRNNRGTEHLLITNYPQK